MFSTFCILKQATHKHIHNSVFISFAVIPRSDATLVNGLHLEVKKKKRGKEKKNKTKKNKRKKMLYDAAVKRFGLGMIKDWHLHLLQLWSKDTSKD